MNTSSAMRSFYSAGHTPRDRTPHLQIHSDDRDVVSTHFHPTVNTSVILPKQTVAGSSPVSRAKIFALFIR